MSAAFSVYLDLVRFLAACLVYVYHSNQRWLVSDVLPFSNYGHSAVIVFFVLSGFVIAWVTEEKENTWRSYFASRLSRVYSVVVPALVVCVLLDAWGRELWALPYGGYPYDQLPARLVASLLMLNEPWFISITSLSNVPFWSITYEFWYYVLFGMVCFLPSRWRWWAAGVLLLLLGPKIALLAPVWVAGVVLYRWGVLKRISLFWGWTMSIGSALLIVLGHMGGDFDALAGTFKSWVGAERYSQFTFSKFFVGDYVLGVLVFCNFAGMRVVAPTMTPLFAVVGPSVKWLAGYTFTFYLMHHPLFLFWGTVLRGDPSTRWSWVIVTALTLASVLLLGLITEKRRPALRRWVLHQLERWPRSAAPAGA